MMGVPQWSAERVDPATVAAVREASGRLADRIVDAVRTGNPTYGDVLSAPEGIGIRLGIEQAIRSFLEAIERGERPAGETAEVWRRLGEAEFQAGRSLDALRDAFRIGTRAAWRGAADLAAELGIGTPAVIALAEGIFIYSDALAVDVVEGYLRMQSDEAGERERRRRRVVTLLLDPNGHDPETLARAAEAARWPVPRELAVLALMTDVAGPLTRQLDVDALVVSDAAGAALVIPDPDGPGRARRLARALGEPAALGPSVPPAHAARSLRWARAALRLMERGTLAADRPTRVVEHLSTIVLLQDEEMAAELVGTRLAPLEVLPGAERDRLIETLAAWLAHQRHTPRIAAELHVHPQTVRYRIGKLRGLLGEAVDTPDGRFELELALRARGALGDGPPFPSVAGG